MSAFERRFVLAVLAFFMLVSVIQSMRISALRRDLDKVAEAEISLAESNKSNSEAIMQLTHAIDEHSQAIHNLVLAILRMR